MRSMRMRAVASTSWSTAAGSGEKRTVSAPGGGACVSRWHAASVAPATSAKTMGGARRSDLRSDLRADNRGDIRATRSKSDARPGRAAPCGPGGFVARPRNATPESYTGRTLAAPVSDATTIDATRRPPPEDDDAAGARAWLVVREGARTQVIDIDDGADVLLGRSSEATVRLDAATAADLASVSSLLGGAALVEAQPDGDYACLLEDAAGADALVAALRRAAPAAVVTLARAPDDGAAADDLWRHAGERATTAGAR